MENKSDRRWKLEGLWRRHQDTTSYRSTVARFLRTHRQSLLASILLFVLLVLLFAIFSQLQPPVTDNPPPGVTVVSYNTFVQQVKTSNMRAVTIQGDELTGVLAHSIQGKACAAPPAITLFSPLPPKDPCTIYTRAPASSDFTLMPLLRSSDVVITTLPAGQSSVWLNLLWKVAPILLFLFLVLSLPPRKGMFSLHTMDDKIKQFARSRARRFERAPEQRNPQPVVFGPGASAQPPEPADPRKLPTSSVTFADVAGIDEIRAELEEVVQFLRSPEGFHRLGAHIPRGILLVGPPGTGKTLLAKAVAGEARVPFFSMNTSEFVEIFVGVGASRVRDLFQQARQAAPCVIFIDEIDAVGRKRSLHLNDSGERDQTLNQLLVELDGFDSRNTVIVLAATNRADMLDAALLRPGRFDRQLTISLPDCRGREAILRVHTRYTPLHTRICLDHLARLTTGMSGADLANLVNEAALCAARRGLVSITPACFEEALARIQLGVQRRLVISEAERRIIAFHESGHALVAHYLPEADNVNCITILPRGQHLGVTQFASQEDRYNYSRTTLMARIAVGLGGRAAVELAFGPEGVTTGAEDDLQAATALAWRMVTHWGMDGQVGVAFADYRGASRTDLNYQAEPVHMGSHSAARYMSSQSTATLIDREVRCILDDGRATARTLLTAHYAQLTKLAETLMKREHLDREQFEAVLKE